MDHGKLTVNKSNPHYISFADGKPFYWFGDTAWELVHRLSREEVALYLESRKNKGFNVIQAVTISEFHHLKMTNFYGDSLFYSNDVLKPVMTKGNNPLVKVEYDYWDHLIYIIESAKAKGLYVALLPTWGEWVTPRDQKALFNSSEAAYSYGWFLSDLVKAHLNIIWTLGGDRQPDEKPGAIQIWNAMAEGIADAANGKKSFDGNADYNNTFFTHHSFESSSKWFHKAPWIDFHMWGSYHSDFYSARSYRQAAADRSLPNPKPTLNGEPCYEDHPVNYALANNGVFSDVDVRNAAYWSMFAGCAGFTYGAHPIWQFADKTRKAYSALTFRTWQEALDLPGAGQIKYLKRLFEERSQKLIPDQTLIASGHGSGADYIAAIRSNSHAFIYIPTGATITVKLGVVTGKEVHVSWLDPRTGEISKIGTYENSGSKQFAVPGISKEVAWLRSGRGCDWVLIINDADGKPEH